jgi:hypothetical protein
LFSDWSASQIRKPVVLKASSAALTRGAINSNWTCGFASRCKYNWNTCFAMYLAGAEAEEDRGPLLRGVCFAALDSHQEGLLWDVCPAFVVMYDPDVAFIRQLEVVAMQHSGCNDLHGCAALWNTQQRSLHVCCCRC